MTFPWNAKQLFQVLPCVLKDNLAALVTWLHRCKRSASSCGFRKNWDSYQAECCSDPVSRCVSLKRNLRCVGPSSEREPGARDGPQKNPFWLPKYFSRCEIFWNLLISSFQEAFLMEKSNASLASKYFSALGCCSTLPVPASACLRGSIGSLNQLRLLSLLIVLYFSMLTLYEGCWFNAMYSLLHSSWQKMFICLNDIPIIILMYVDELYIGVLKHKCRHSKGFVTSSVWSLVISCGNT